MRVNFGLIPVAVALFGWAAQAHDFASSEDIFEARELVDEFTQFERRSEILADFTTRELVTELSDRLERRGNIISKKSFKCVYCGKKYDTAAKAKFCGTNSVLTGGCRPVGS